MLKTVSSITNAIGALNFKGTWNAATNTPTIVSGVGVKGDYFVVGVTGSTTIDGISNWGVGDWIAYNGTVWQRVEGGADLNGVNLSVSGTTTLSGLTASTALALDASKDVVSVTNTGTGNNVLATTPSFATTIGLGSATASVSGSGITFPAMQSVSTDANTLDDYEEGTFQPSYTPETGAFTTLTYTTDFRTGSYTKVGNLVTVNLVIATSVVTVGTASGILFITGLPFVAAQQNANIRWPVEIAGVTTLTTPMFGYVQSNTSQIVLSPANNSRDTVLSVSDLTTGSGASRHRINLTVSYLV